MGVKSQNGLTNLKRLPDMQAVLITVLDDLIANVAASSNAFAQSVRASAPAIICEVGHYSNDDFVLRSFVSIRTDNDNDELALSVDISRSDANGTILIESDFCMDDGTIVATGPALTLPTAKKDSAAAAASWSESFDAFLNESEAAVMLILKRMNAERTKRV